MRAHTHTHTHTCARAYISYTSTYACIHNMNYTYMGMYTYTSYL